MDVEITLRIDNTEYRLSVDTRPTALEALETIGVELPERAGGEDRILVGALGQGARGGQLDRWGHQLDERAFGWCGRTRNAARSAAVRVADGASAATGTGFDPFPKSLLNRLFKQESEVGIPPPADAVFETAGQRAGQPGRTPACNRIENREPRYAP